jgi:prefoldin subunit 5
MNKIRLFITIGLMAFSAVTQAEQALSKELIASFQKVSAQWETLEMNYPDLSASLEDLDFSQPEKLITQLKSSQAYPQIKSILATYDFASIEEYYNVAMRVMGGMMAHQMNNMPEGMNIDSMVNMLKNNIQQMKSSNAPSSMIDEMNNQLADLEKSMMTIQQAMKSTSAADKKFISDNAPWIMSMLDNEEED